MPGSWRDVQLGDVAEDVTVGYVGTMASEYLKDGIPFLRSLNIRPHSLDLTDIRYISRAFHERLRKSALAPGDVVTVRTGKPGATAVVPPSLPEANCSDVVITRPGSNLDARWLSYYINGVADGFVASRLVGAVQQHFNVGSAKEMLLALPPLVEQRGIGTTLGLLDDKVESNRRAIELANQFLDATIEALSSELPTAPLSALTSVDRSTTNPSNLGEAVVDHFSLPAFDEAVWPDRTPASSIMSNKLAVTGSSILVSRLNPRFNRTWWVKPVGGVPALASTEFSCLTASSPEALAALWLAVRDAYFRAELARRVTGTSGSHQRIRPDDMLAIEVPDTRLLDPTTKQEALSLLELAHLRRREIIELSALRDTLLPELLSGRIRVPEAEQTLEGTFP